VGDIAPLCSAMHHEILATQMRAIASGEFNTVSIFPRHKQTRVDLLSGRRG